MEKLPKAALPETAHAEDRAETFVEMYQDPEMYTVSLRRHGEYERDRESVQRGQLTQETMPAVREAAQEWIANVPEDAAVRLITSPTGMPAVGPTGKEIMPARARMTGALYGSELRKEFGDDYGRLDRAEVSERNAEVVAALPEVIDRNATRTTERELGDLFEFTDNSKGQFVQPFFKALSEAYGGMTPDFWQDYIRGQLPEEVNEKLIEGGGETALQKSMKVTQWLETLNAERDAERKNVTLAISHEEVIGSFAYQIAEYLKDTGSASAEDIEKVADAHFSYNQGFDIHVDHAGVAVIEINGAHVAIELAQLGTYLQEKEARLEAARSAKK